MGWFPRMTPEGGKIGTHDDKYGNKNVTAGDKIDAVSDILVQEFLAI